MRIEVRNSCATNTERRYKGVISITTTIDTDKIETSVKKRAVAALERGVYHTENSPVSFLAFTLAEFYKMPFAHVYGWGKDILVLSNYTDEQTQTLAATLQALLAISTTTVVTVSEGMAARGHVGCVELHIHTEWDRENEKIKYHERRRKEADRRRLVMVVLTKHCAKLTKVQVQFLKDTLGV